MATQAATGGESTRDRVLRAVRESDDPFITAAEIAEQLGESRSLVNYHLGNLQEDGLVGRKTAGAQAVGWWYSGD